MTELEILRLQLDITKKYLVKMFEIAGRLHGGSKKALKVEQEYWRELDGIPAIGGEVTIDEPVLLTTQTVKKVKEPNTTSQPRGKGGPKDWVYVQKEGEKATMIPAGSLDKYKKLGWVEGSGKIWVTDGTVNRKITMDELKDFKKQGFVRGKTNRVA